MKREESLVCIETTPETHGRNHLEAGLKGNARAAEELMKVHAVAIPLKRG